MPCTRLRATREDGSRPAEAIPPCQMPVRSRDEVTQRLKKPKGHKDARARALRSRSLTLALVGLGFNGNVQGRCFACSVDKTTRHGPAEEGDASRILSDPCLGSAQVNGAAGSRARHMASSVHQLLVMKMRSIPIPIHGPTRPASGPL
ncbi:hypothetical protein LRP88_10021 [Fusarium phalaenopsidis]